MQPLSVPALRGTLIAIFTVSGFAGLIYESIWTHYLKLFLGHAAYAQTLVLAIFMGGLAGGAWLAADLSRRLRRPLIGYAVAEAAIGLAALGFDPLFRVLTVWMYDAVLPQLGAPLLVDLVKWSTAGAIILPQSILLGMTFPLMSAGLLRAVPGASGYTLAALYFSNSLGASIGVLCSGFWLIPAVGLPGTMMTAGLLNLAVALAVWRVARGGEPAPAAAPAPPPTATHAGTPALLLATAFFTGAASFLYEIGWIRMLSLVLGSATHSFELMLSAFILGLALGSFLIRRHIDRFASPLAALGVIQVVMALLAALTVVGYAWCFDFMAFMMKGLAKNDAGWTLFNLASHGLCLAMMLPATLCAGMTLPLITHALYVRGHDERTIGRVYAANTVGAIVGVLAAVHIVMPLLGLRQVILVGALVDLALGVVLLRRAGLSWRPAPRLALAAALAGFAAIAAFARFDPNRLTSGVFRSGVATTNQVVEFHRDGKTASIDVKRHRNIWTISTNGKPDAGVSLGPQPSTDEPTMVLLGLLPLVFDPQARNVAVIGMGSGLTTHSLLQFPGVERVDTIEIESQVLAGARLFAPMVGSAFDDPRSAIHIDDAKTFFARHHTTYDAIVSEPSNPWVSGTATLFSTEFYRHVRRYLADGGLFVQWIQLYEIDAPLLMTILRALQPHFADYSAYLGDSSDLIIIAKKDGRLSEVSAQVLAHPALQPLLARHRLASPAELDLHRVTGRDGIDALLALAAGPANSDYYPVLDTGAARTRFLDTSARGPIYALYQFERLLGRAPPATVASSPRPLYAARAVEEASLIAQQLEAWLHDGAAPARPLDPARVRMLAAVLSRSLRCDARDSATLWLPHFVDFMSYWSDLLPGEVLTAVDQRLRATPCQADRTEPAARWLALLRARAQADAHAVFALASDLALDPRASDVAIPLVQQALVAVAASGDRGLLTRLFEQQGARIAGDPDLNLLQAQVGIRLARGPEGGTEGN